MAERMDTKDITTAYGVSASRLSEWYRDRATTRFPEPVGTDGRRRLWDKDDIAHWFATDYVRLFKRGGRPVLSSEGDLDELLTAPQVARLLGLKNTTTVYAYLRDGRLPEPDQAETLPSGNLRRFWRRRTIVEWDTQRPGRGNTLPKSPRPAAATDTVEVTAVDGTVSSAEAAKLLGYASIQSFTSAVAQGQLPQLGEPVAAAAAPGPGRPSRRWQLERVLEEAERRSSAARASSADADFRARAVREALQNALSAVGERVGRLPAKVPVDQVADVLGYSSVEHLRRAVRSGPLAALGVASAEPVWPRDVVRAAARDRAAAGVSAKALAELHGRGSLAQWHGALVEARAEVLPA